MDVCVFFSPNARTQQAALSCYDLYSKMAASASYTVAAGPRLVDFKTFVIEVYFVIKGTDDKGKLSGIDGIVSSKAMLFRPFSPSK